MTDEKKIDPNSFEALTDDEKAAALRAQLYMTHKVRSSLGTYYQMFPDEMPARPQKIVEQGRER